MNSKTIIKDIRDGRIIWEENNLITFDKAIANCINAGVSLRYSDFTDTCVDHARFVSQDLTGACFQDARANHTEFHCCTLTGANMNFHSFCDGYFNDCTISGTNFDSFKEEFRSILQDYPRAEFHVSDAIGAGNIHGARYDGFECCIVGHIARSCNLSIDNILEKTCGGTKNIESLISGIRPGHSPRNNALMTLLEKWCEEFK